MPRRIKNWTTKGVKSMIKNFAQSEAKTSVTTDTLEGKVSYIMLGDVDDMIFMHEDYLVSDR